MDAITLLKDDHKTVERLFKQFEKAGDKAYAEKRKLAARICTELSVHAAIEEQLFYPVIRGTVEGVEDMTLEALEEHHIVKWVLSELDDLDPKDERFTAKMTVLIENVRHHVEEEEDDLFPKVRDAIGRKDLADLGQAMEAAKSLAPTHPHPRSPDTPPGNIVVGVAAGVADRVGDTVKDAAQGAVSNAQDFVGRILGSRNGTSTTSSRARSTKATGKATVTRTARKATSSAKKATGSAKKATGSATSTAKRTARKATATTKKATGTAKKAGTTAKRSAAQRTAATKRAATRG